MDAHFLTESGRIYRISSTDEAGIFAVARMPKEETEVEISFQKAQILVQGDADYADEEKLLASRKKTMFIWSRDATPTDIGYFNTTAVFSITPVE